MLADVIIQPKPNKAEAFLAVRDAILSQCDLDIREAFTMHSFTVEPLLIQLIREVRKTNEYYRVALADVIRAADDAAERDNPIANRESGASPEAPKSNMG